MCECAWQQAGECANGCAAEGVELVVDPARAVPQLCAPLGGAAAFALPTLPGATPAAPCDEGERYRCESGMVVECGSSTVVARCTLGCAQDGGVIDDDGVSRVAAFAILCSR
jgi:hypothetical protein